MQTAAQSRYLRSCDLSSRSCDLSSRSFDRSSRSCNQSSRSRDLRIENKLVEEFNNY